MVNYARYIDHTVLKADASKDAVTKLCQEAKEHNFASVCVNPTWVEYCAEQLQGTDVLVCTVIGFPLGANTPETKAFETSDAIAKGAKEVDMVINIGALKDGNLELVKKDIAAVVNASKGKATSKVIIETCLLSDEEKVAVCKIAKEVGADFVKTSTGFSTGGATVADVTLMRSTVGTETGVKASGGVRNGEDFQKMLDAGANRIGTSAGVALVQGKEAGGSY
ncbi:MAG: deoxyribose-phosphate aldolase [Bacilli bacterium]